MQLTNRLKYVVSRLIARKQIRKRLKRNSPRTVGNNILLNVPSHGNLGDHLICIAEKKLLKNISNNDIEIFSTGDLYFGYDIIKSYIIDSDIIFITGGGFLGSLWPEEELRVQKIIEDFSQNKIVILPQTIYFDTSRESCFLLDRAKSIYGSHQNLLLTVRERASYNFAQNFMNIKNLMLLPDMALYLKFNSGKRRNGALICMRDDKEKLINNSVDTVIDYIGRNYKVKKIDTQINRSVSQSQEEEEVSSLINEFNSSNIVITDRLHGMIFATITSTPVIVFNNLSNKIKNVYESWLKDIPYILYIENDKFNLADVIEFVNNRISSINEFENIRFVNSLESLKHKL